MPRPVLTPNGSFRQDTARRGPQSSVSAVRRRPRTGSSEDSEDSEEDRRRVSSTVRVTDRPRPPAHLLPRPALLVKAMKDAQRSTGAVGRTARRRQQRANAKAAKPTLAATAAGKKVGIRVFHFLLFFSQNVSFRPDSHYFIFLMKFGGRYSLFKPIL